MVNTRVRNDRGAIRAQQWEAIRRVDTTVHRIAACVD